MRPKIIIVDSYKQRRKAQIKVFKRSCDCYRLLDAERVEHWKQESSLWVRATTIPDFYHICLMHAGESMKAIQRINAYNIRIWYGGFAQYDPRIQTFVQNSSKDYEVARKIIHQQDYFSQQEATDLLNFKPGATALPPCLMPNKHFQDLLNLVFGHLLPDLHTLGYDTSFNKDKYQIAFETHPKAHKIWQDTQEQLAAAQAENSTTWTSTRNRIIHEFISNIRNLERS